MILLIKHKKLEILKIDLKIRKLVLEILKDIDLEIFLPIDGFDNYFISNFGNIKNSKTNKILKLDNHRDGYKQINLYKNGKIKKFTIHRLIAIAFLENPDNKKVIDHIDNNPANNNVKNLRWATSKDNSANTGKYINNTTGFKGVSFHKPSNNFRAMIHINGNNKHFGLFETAEEASKVYDAKAKEIHKDFFYKNKQNIKFIIYIYYIIYMNDNLNIARFNQLLMVSNPTIVKRNLKIYIPTDTPELFLSNRKNKKYQILNPETNKFIHFGSIAYQDFTKHKD